MLKHQNVYHPFRPDHGPFNIYKCRDCGSAQTYPNPTVEELDKLYGSYRNGLPDLHRNIMEEDPQTAVYSYCVAQVRMLLNIDANSKFTWLDIGAGGGEFSSLMAHAFPVSQGIAVDLHPSPLKNYQNTVTWQQLNFNTHDISNQLPQVDLIVSIGVWEHVLEPDIFIQNLLKSLKPKGTLYLLCPDNGSLASHILGKSWPLFTPGEHLSIPTKVGASKCIQNSWDKIPGNNGKLVINSYAVMLPYTIGYLFKRLGLNKIGQLIPKGITIPMPLGALETVSQRQ
jgi:SAM-dependent methyltransferase